MTTKYLKLLLTCILLIIILILPIIIINIYFKNKYNNLDTEETCNITQIHACNYINNTYKCILDVMCKYNDSIQNIILLLNKYPEISNWVNVDKYIDERNNIKEKLYYFNYYYVMYITFIIICLVVLLYKKYHEFNIIVNIEGQ